MSGRTTQAHEGQRGTAPVRASSKSAIEKRRAQQARPISVQFENPLGSRRLVQPVDVLRDDGGKRAPLFELRQKLVRGIRRDSLAGIFLRKPLPIRLRVGLEEVDGQNALDRDFAILMEKPFGAAKVRYARLRRDPGAAEKDDAIRLRDPLSQLAPLTVHTTSLDLGAPRHSRFRDARPSATPAFRTPFHRARPSHRLATSELRAFRLSRRNVTG